MRRSSSADAAIISDSEFFARGLPSITYSLRGLAYVEVTFRGPSADIHSGLNGGAVTNPVNALARLVAGMQDSAGRVTLPGFYDDVLALDATPSASSGTRCRSTRPSTPRASAWTPWAAARRA